MAFFELDGVSKGYGAGAHRSEVLRGVDLGVEKGEFIAIVGFSGSGKTTLISLMAGLLQPDTGQVRLAPVQYRVEPGDTFRSQSSRPTLCPPCLAPCR